MTDIVVTGYNQLYAKIVCESGVGLEIAEAMSFYVDGYKFMPQYKRGFWDGKIRLYNRSTHLIYKGLAPRLIGWARRNNYSVGVANKELLLPSSNYPDGWVEENWSKYGKFEPMEHQLKGVADGLKLSQCLIHSPTGSGKSYIIYLMIRYIIEHTDKKILICVPSVQLVEQMASDFASYEVDSGFSEGNIHKIHGGVEKHSDKRIFISTWQSVYKLERKWFDQFDAFICDEAHGASAASLTGIIDKMPNSKYRIGLTGTLKGTKMHLLEMEGRFGPVVTPATSKELMNRDVLSRLDITAVRLKYSADEAKQVHGMTYADQLSFIVTHPRRNEMLCDLACSVKGNTLMLFNYIKVQGDALKAILDKKAEAAGKKVYYIDGNTKVDEREFIRAQLEANNNCILLATFGTLAVGINIKNLVNIIFCHPYKARVKTLQSIGRSLRKLAGKNSAHLYDIGDDLTYKTRTGKETPNIILGHFVERLKIYDSEQYAYKLKVVDIHAQQNI